MLDWVIMTGEPNQVKRPSVYGLDASLQSTRMKPNNYSPYMPGPSTYTNNFSFYSNFGQIPASVTFPLPPIEAAYSDGVSNSTALTRCKRKMDDTPISRSVKQHITEDRMAEHLSKLHISTQNPAPSSEPETTETTEKRLYMCEVMRKLQTESVIPQSLLDRVTGPCKALVLWSPPQRIFPVLPNIAEDENYDNNNEEAVPDNNLMDLDR
nr:uncharacterized protein LOC111424087 [Onthophagus taurus]XP_022913279.1 uncharacterized protein LOC111424087 [Onthophagus taurus]